jgi:hypothetical protein
VWAGPANAQSNLTPSEYNALVQALETTTPQPASEAPLVGNFYTLTHGESWPPLPADTMGLPFWNVQGWYILDDRNFDYSASRAESAFGRMHPMDGGFDGFFTPLFTSNQLWLSITNVTNGDATLIIHPPSGLDNGVFDLLFRTNPLPPDSWHFVLRTLPGQTNLTVSNAVGPEGFYALGKADSSQGTNFWLVFPSMDLFVTPVLSLYISSPVGATGTVTIQGQSNGPTLAVTGANDDPSIYGTYVLTNMYLDPRTYLGFSPFNLTGAPVSNVYVKGPFRIFFDESDDFGWVLGDSTSNSVIYEGPYGVDNLNAVDWAGLYNGDGILETACAEDTLVLPFAVAAGSVTRIPIPMEAMVNLDDVIVTNSAINVLAGAPVSVYAVNYDPNDSAAFIVYPVPLLGTNYDLIARPALARPDSGQTNFSFFALMAVQNGTTVRVTPSAGAGLTFPPGGGPFQTNLQQGQIFQVTGATQTNDVTGTIVASDKPVAVFAGDFEAYVPDTNTQAGNPLVQEQIPVDDWGTNVISLSFAGRTGGDSYRVLPAQNGTRLYTNGMLVATNMQAGIPYDYTIDGGVQFTATEPIQVAHFANGTVFDSQLGDPCEILVPSTGHYLETNTIITPIGEFTSNYINIIVAQTAINNTLVDSSHLSASNFVQIGTTGYYGLRYTVTSSGTHTVVSSQPVSVDAYGWGITDAYGYSGGMVK